jgi:hypothetical protein
MRAVDQETGEGGEIEAAASEHRRHPQRDALARPLK